ncbi:MAG: hypothetical protein ACD_39C00498G0004 [uncultured bacterium]|nr:MAG: hypothetical protein ACD_39C00498G0004 [uncultured bacterium]
MFKKCLLLMVLFIGLSGHVMAQNYEFILYAFPPAASLDWSSPLKLAYGAGLKGRLVFEHGKNKHTIGHCFMELRKDGKRVELTGSTTAADAPSDADFITKHGYGLGVLFAPMKGALDNSDKLDGELIDRYKTGKVMFIRFAINEQAYLRMKQYIDEYRARGYDKIYNGSNEPRKGTGAGCSAFAMSFLDICGYIDPVFSKEWIRRVNLPKSLVGGPVTGNHVSLAKTIFKAHWAKPGEEAVKLALWDPELMFNWLKNTHKQAFQLYKEKGNYKDMKILGKNFRFDQRGKATGLIIDITDLPPATDQVWQN